MNQPMVDGLQRIFVVGVPRSGTTLVQSLLAAHDGVTSFTESHFFSRLYRNSPLLGPVLVRHPAPRVRAFLAENQLDAAAYAEAKALLAPSHGWTLPARSRRVAQQFAELLDAIARRRGAAAWVEKTPRHLHFLPRIEGLSGARQTDVVHTMHVVHVIRGGMETVASLHKASQQWSHPYDLEACVRRWNDDLALSLRYLARPSSGSVRHHPVLYEDLASDPESTLRSLLDQLGLSWQVALLQRFREGAGKWVAKSETWKAGVGRKIEPSSSAHQVLSEAQRRRVQTGLRQNQYISLQRLAADRRNKS